MTTDEIAGRVRSEKKLWDAFQDAELDKRLAERGSDAEKIEAAQSAYREASDAWHANRNEIKQGLADLIGVTVEELRGTL